MTDTKKDQAKQPEKPTTPPTTPENKIQNAPKPKNPGAVEFGEG